MTDSPFYYGLCSQRVTIYRKQGDTVLRQVVENCYLSRQEEFVTDVLGTRQGVEFRLIIPGNRQQIHLGDRVYDGIGPEISAAEWKDFLPATVPGLVQVSYVRPCVWEGEICHVEAGHRQTARPQL